ncbi:MAG: hypothetical protein KatS3mg027_2480 [Bacteroidia bacterium]|jgi:hypothetical protein|nr:MAG: hypothetical protein KatS3mg027_2480 [Bacteroidia bacterium]
MNQHTIACVKNKDSSINLTIHKKNTKKESPHSQNHSEQYIVHISCRKNISDKITSSLTMSVFIHLTSKLFITFVEKLLCALEQQHKR